MVPAVERSKSVGLFSAYLGYRYARKKFAKQQRDGHDLENEVCDDCGHEFRQHSDDGECPQYGSDG